MTFGMAEKSVQNLRTTARSAVTIRAIEEYAVPFIRIGMPIVT
ncbi:hypothetical protein [Actinocrispum sp. NPDC049592]